MAKSVVVYIANWCPWCHSTTSFLKKNKIKFQSRNVDDNKYAEESIQKSGQNGIPVIDIDGKIIIGFDEPKLREVLKL
jgi:glutaredoxin